MKTAKEWAKEILDMSEGDQDRARAAMEDGAFLAKIGFPDDVALSDVVYDLLGAFVSTEPETEDWEPEETNTEEIDVSVNTQVECFTCGGKSFLRDGKCAKCDHGLI